MASAGPVAASWNDLPCRIFRAVSVSSFTPITSEDVLGLFTEETPVSAVTMMVMVYRTALIDIPNQNKKDGN